MTMTPEKPTTNPPIYNPPTVPLESMTREQIKRHLVEVIAASYQIDEACNDAWAEIDERKISVSEFSGALDADERIPHAHETTWNRRKNRAMDKPNWRSDDPSVQRRRRRGGT